jgi:hypothetical protein
METVMKRVVLALSATAALSGPILAQTMDLMLPTLSFPEDPVVTTQGSGDATTAPVLDPRE